MITAKDEHPRSSDFQEGHRAGYEAALGILRLRTEFCETAEQYARAIRLTLNRLDHEEGVQI